MSAASSVESDSSGIGSFDSAGMRHPQSQVKETELDWADETGVAGDDDDKTRVEGVDEDDADVDNDDCGVGAGDIDKWRVDGVEDTRRTVATRAERVTVQVLGPTHAIRSSGRFPASTALRAGAVIRYLHTTSQRRESLPHDRTM
jgi:hypothetical protein